MKKRLDFLLVLCYVVLMMCPLGLNGQNASDKAAVYSGYKLADEGAWCWFADPRALHYESPSGKINSSYIGYIDVHGNVKAVQYDFLSGRRQEVLVRSYFQPDDHNNPTFLVLPDERIMIFYSRHTDEPCFYYRISCRPGDISALGEEKKIMTKDNTTYPSPFILSDDPEHIYLCWRGIHWHPTIARLTLPDKDDEVKIDWGPYQMVQSSGARPYAKYQSNGKDKIMLVYTTGHPDNEQPNWLYFNNVNIKTLQLEDVNGKVLSSIADGPWQVNKSEAYAEKNPLTIVDRTAGIRDWVWQVASDASGRPVIAMVKISDDKTSHDYYYVRWDGAQWKAYFLANGGGHFHQTPDIEKCYSGGMAIDPVNPETVYCSVPVWGAFGRVYEIVKYTVNVANGQIDEERVTRHSRKNNARPYVIPGSAHSPLRLVWMNGDYYDWIVSNQRSGYPTAIHGDFAFPEPVLRTDSALIGRYTVPFAQRAFKVERKLRKGDFTIIAEVLFDDNSQGGLICAGNGWSYGVNGTTWKPYVDVNNGTFTSNNVLGTADSWRRYPRGTNGDWYPVEKMKSVCLALTFDNNKIVTYVNGLIDQVVPVSLRKQKSFRFGGFKGMVKSYRVYSRVLSQEEINSLVSESHQ